MAKFIQTFITASALVLMSGTADAEIYDLSGSNTTVTVDAGVGSAAMFSDSHIMPAGTGYIDPFLRTHVPGQSSEGTWCGTGGGSLDGKCEQGYNTDGRPVEFDTKDENQWTKSLLLSDLVNPDDNTYVEFLLDINQLGNAEGQLLSLDELQFFVTTNPDLLGYDDATNTFITIGDDVALAWEMDRFKDSDIEATLGGGAGEDDYILLQNCDQPGKCGSGDFDMLAQIAYQDFIDASADLNGGAGLADGEELYVVLFNRFGDNAGTGKNNPGANDGFEEWSGVLFVGDNHVPEPGIASLLLVGMVGVWANRRRRKTA